MLIMSSFRILELEVSRIKVLVTVGRVAVEVVRVYKIITIIKVKV